MTNTTRMPLYRVNNEFNLAANSAFGFVNNKDKYRKRNNRRRKIVEEIGGKVSPFWVFMSFFVIFAAIFFAIFAAKTAQGTIAAFVDPMASGNISLIWLSFIGAAISIFGMGLGHLIFEGISEGISRDPYTGKREYSTKLWKSFWGILFSFLFIGFQFLIVKLAASGEEGSGSGLSNMPYLIVGLAIIEIGVGALFLHRALGYLMLFGIGLLLFRTSRNLNDSARSTNMHYRQYLNYLDEYNRQYPNGTIEAEGNHNLRIAIAHYSGINLSDNRRISGVENQNSLSEAVPQQALPLPQERNVTRENVPRPEENPQIANFLEDKTDDNLTV